MEDQKKAMTPEEFIAQRTKTITLPCGLAVRVQLPTPFQLLKFGPIPKLESVELAEGDEGKREHDRRAYEILWSSIVEPRNVGLELYTRKEIDLLLEGVFDFVKVGAKPEDSTGVPLAEAGSGETPQGGSTESRSDTAADPQT